MGERIRAHDLKRKVVDALPRPLAEKIEGVMRNRYLEKTGYIPLNDLVTYELDPNYSDDVSLHIAEKLTGSPTEIYRLFLDGLGKLAEELKMNPDLESKQFVAGHSRLIYDHPQLLERLGFTVSERDDEKRTALAKMARTEFLQRFGTQN